MKFKTIMLFMLFCLIIPVIGSSHSIIGLTSTQYRVLDKLTNNIDKETLLSSQDLKNLLVIKKGIPEDIIYIVPGNYVLPSNGKISDLLKDQYFCSSFANPDLVPTWDDKKYATNVADIIRKDKNIAFGYIILDTKESETSIIMNVFVNYKGDIFVFDPTICTYPGDIDVTRIRKIIFGVDSDYFN